ncbi:hypothetical protein [Peptoclostridium litorale]|nr:hypothetical protein [Peptoclostridium litorale]
MNKVMPEFTMLDTGVEFEKNFKNILLKTLKFLNAVYDKLVRKTK